MSTAKINIRVDTDTKNTAKVIFEELGLDLSTAVNLFLKRSIAENGLPFELKLRMPNTETIRAIEESENGIGLSRSFDSAEEMFEDLEI